MASQLKNFAARFVRFSITLLKHFSFSLSPNCLLQPLGEFHSSPKHPFTPLIALIDLLRQVQARLLFLNWLT